LLLPVLSLKADDKSEPPVPVRTVPPEVPSSFSRSGSVGLVTINFLVDTTGNVQEPTVVKASHPELAEPALKAIKKWRFKPATKDGVAVAVHVTIPIKFDNQ
jgi:protein TonB